jgi:glycosyltransferase involved in cell wall biosynthesis
MTNPQKPMISVVIPCYRVKDHILEVLKGIGPEVGKIYLVDDACPEGSGQYVMDSFSDPRLDVIFHPKNLGVGGAVKTGYRKALKDGATIIVKLDGDGQMNPQLINKLVDPIVKKQADYVKGNRFYDLDNLRKMPGLRRFGNALLSFASKMVSGYWNVMDPTNGFTAINSAALKNLPIEKLDDGFFFEQDLLFRLNTIRAVVTDLPMIAHYGKENSNLRIRKVLFTFPFKYFNRLFKRIFYSYFLRDFNVGSLELILAFLFMGFGIVFGTIKWAQSISTGLPATAGTVILAGLPVILGFQAFLSFLHFDLTNIPGKPLSGFED